MLDALFLTVHDWLDGGPLAAGLGAFLWGVVSVVFSPCHLASVPLIIGYVAGQNKIIEGRQAAGYAAVFTMGLFITIALIGLVCSLLGRMLGDVGPWWAIPVGAVLVWVGLDMLGVVKCSLPGGSGLSRLKMRGMGGAFALGLCYGALSGACTFGFIAPILAIITIQGQVAAGVALILLFALGHCLPIALAGGSAATVRRLLENSAYVRGGLVFRQLAGALVGALGLYFAASPFLGRP